MIVYANGDSHTAGAEAVNSHCFAYDDPLYYGLRRQPHPDNLRASYGCHLANSLNAIFECDAESGSSNERIIRTTRNYLTTERPDLVIIGWATWEREEFLINDVYYQFSAGRIMREWPKSVEEKYTEWVLTADPHVRALHWHDTIYNFHLELKEQQIPHLFFNTLHAFNYSNITPQEWHGCYINPYSADGTYFHYLKNQGHTTVNQDSYHFGADAHRTWGEYLLTKLTNESIIKP